MNGFTATKIESITAAIAAATNKLSPKVADRAKLASKRAALEADGAAAEAHNASMARAYSKALGLHASGTVSDADLAAVRVDASLAHKAMMAATKNNELIARYAEAEQIATGDDGDEPGIASLEAILIDLRADLAAAVKEAGLVALEAEFHAEKVAYTAAASAAMLALGKSYARHIALQVAGRDPGLFTSGLHASQLGCYADSPLTASFVDAITAERARLQAAGFRTQPATPNVN